jgi:hypothetical protein
VVKVDDVLKVVVKDVLKLFMPLRNQDIMQNLQCS